MGSGDAAPQGRQIILLAHGFRAFGSQHLLAFMLRKQWNPIFSQRDAPAPPPILYSFIHSLQWRVVYSFVRSFVRSNLFIIQKPTQRSHELVLALSYCMNNPTTNISRLLRLVPIFGRTVLFSRMFMKKKWIDGLTDCRTRIHDHTTAAPCDIWTWIGRRQLFLARGGRQHRSDHS